MSPEKESALIESFPMLYRGVDEGPMSCLICFGMECDDGWFDLIFELSRQICEMSPMTKAMQVKEKFGALRFYVSGGESVIFDIIDQFEECSVRICEVCGAPGKTRGMSWLKTLCDKHAKEMGYSNATRNPMD